MIDISKDLSPSFFQNKDFTKGKVLIFDDNGTRNEFKIVRFNRKKKTCWVEPIKLYTEDEINDMDRKDAEEIIKNG